jgi:ABC-2 type transport system permease protein
MSFIIFSALLRGALRDKLTLFWSLVFPLLLTFGLGSAFTEEAYRASLLGSVTLMSAVFFASSGTTFTVLGQRNRGVYKLMRVTPFSTVKFIGVLTAARLVVSALCVSLVVSAAALMLGRAVTLFSLVLLLPVLLVTMVSFALLGFTFGNLANNEGQAAALGNLVNLPLLFLSSAFYPLESAPRWLQKLSNVLPFEGFLQATRAAFSEDQGSMLRALPPMLGFALLCLLAAIFTFRWDPFAPLSLRLRNG